MDVPPPVPGLGSASLKESSGLSWRKRTVQRGPRPALRGRDFPAGREHRPPGSRLHVALLRGTPSLPVLPKSQ